MKKTLLVLIAAIALVVGYSPAAQADAFLSLSNGSTTVSCNNSTSAGVTACSASGFATSLGSNSIIFAGGTVGGYAITQVSLTSNSPGSPAAAFALDTKTGATNVTGGASSLTVQFAVNNFTLPLGNPLTLSASQSGTFTVAAVGDNEAFTAGGDAANSLTPLAGVQDTTPLCVNASISPPQTACSTAGIPTTFARSGAFALSGQEIISLAQGDVASFTATVAATPAAVPEPSSLLLLGAGMIILAGGRKLRRK